MDGQRFDALAKTLVADRSRRSVLKLLISAAAGGLLSVLGVSTATTACQDLGGACGANEDCCSATCLDGLCADAPASEEPPDSESTGEPVESGPVGEEPAPPEESAEEPATEGSTEEPVPVEEGAPQPAPDEPSDPLEPSAGPSEEGTSAEESASEPAPAATAEADAPLSTGQVVTADAVQVAAGEFSIPSTIPGWHQTSLSLQQGEQFAVSYVSGTWTVDYRLFPYVGPEGYPPEIDRQVYQGCKLDPSLPYARLLGRVGDGPFFSVGRGGTFAANASGVLALKIHDHDACLGDNDGAVIMRVGASADTEIPGGTWISPDHNFVVRNNRLHFAAHAFDNPGGSGVDYVNFTAFYDTWHVACQATAPTPDTTDVYECDWDLPAGLAGRIKVSFDVYDRAGNYNLAPHGIREGTVAPAGAEQTVRTRFRKPTEGVTSNGFERGGHQAVDIQSTDRPDPNSPLCLVEEGSIGNDGQPSTTGDWDRSGDCDDWQGAAVVAAGAGIVERVGEGPMSGHFVYIDHGTLADKRKVETRYLHLGTKVRDGYRAPNAPYDICAGELRQSFIAGGLGEGDCVWAGHLIGYQGYSGCTTATHLHYEVLVGGQKVNPENWFTEVGGIPIGSFEGDVDLVPPSECPST